MDTTHLQNLCREYSLGEVFSITDVTEGILNKNYILETSSGKFFIKLVREKSRALLPYTAAAEELMRERGIPAICMLVSKGGEKFVSYGKATYSVYPFIESDRSHTYNLEDYRTMGVMLGKVHRAGSTDIPSFFLDKHWKEKPKEQTVTDLEEYKSRILAKETRDAIDDTFLVYINLKLDLVPTLEMDTVLSNSTLIQGDYHAGNLLINKTTREIVGICDWEKAEMAPRAMELARSILYICFDGEYEDAVEINTASSFLSGYITEYPIDKEEILAGFQVRLRRHILTSWLENHYYNYEDGRGNHFVAHEIRIIKDFLKGDLLRKLMA